METVKNVMATGTILMATEITAMVTETIGTVIETTAMVTATQVTKEEEIPDTKETETPTVEETLVVTKGQGITRDVVPVTIDRPIPAMVMNVGAQEDTSAPMATAMATKGDQAAHLTKDVQVLTQDQGLKNRITEMEDLITIRNEADLEAEDLSKRTIL